MTRYTATIELDAEQLALLEDTASFMGMPLQQLLDASLQSGIAHAEEFYRAELDRAHTEGAYLDVPDRKQPIADPTTAHLASDMDDGLPF